ncbi:MAG: hypothetical protein KME46_27835 [Brasilonema angustatum HA4187-MV1]|jgi:hypothetical protein|nr:hypothetical protein [Brasilonema angustatum HA4187-MV1]
MRKGGNAVAYAEASALLKSDATLYKYPPMQAIVQVEQIKLFFTQAFILHQKRYTLHQNNTSLNFLTPNW